MKMNEGSDCVSGYPTKDVHIFSCNHLGVTVYAEARLHETSQMSYGCNTLGS